MAYFSGITMIKATWMNLEELISPLFDAFGTTLFLCAMLATLFVMGYRLTSDGAKAAEETKKVQPKSEDNFLDIFF